MCDENQHMYHGFQNYKYLSNQKLLFPRVKTSKKLITRKWKSDRISSDICMKAKMLWKWILNLDICSPWSEAVFMLNRMKMAISDSEQPHSSNGLFFTLTCKQPPRHTALLIKCDFELWSITCIRLSIATSSVNSNMTKTVLLVKSDFELWSVTCIEHNFYHSPALRMVNSTCLQQHLIEFTFCHNDWSLLIVLYWLLFSNSILPSYYWRISIRCFCLWIGSWNIVQLLKLFIRKNVFWS